MPEIGAGRRSPAVVLGEWLFRYRNAVFPVGVGLLLFGLPPVPLGGDPGLDRWLDLAGVLLAAGGQALRATVIGLAYIKRGGLNKRIHASELVTAGLFAHARNPLYLGNLLILAGLIVVHNNPWAYAIGLPLALAAYAAIVRAEERHLAARFGAAYADYCARVPRWIPRLRGLAATVRGMQFRWRRVVLKDHATCYYWAVTLLALLAVEQARFQPPGAREAGALLAAFALLSALLVLARIARKSGLRADA